MPKGIEAAKLDQARKESGFYSKYLSGRGIDLGYKGLGLPEGMEPITETAIGVDLDYPGYDGTILPFPTESLDFVFSSHTLEHIPDYVKALQEWHRVVKVGGYIVICVPHAFLYEKSFYVPGPWGSCPDHKRAYTPARLLREIEESLKPNSYRVVSLQDQDQNFDYAKVPTTHPNFFHECFEIECVIQKRVKPGWEIV